MLDTNVPNGTTQAIGYLEARIPKMHELTELVNRLVNEKMTKVSESVDRNMHEQAARLGQAHEDVNRRLQDHVTRMDGLMTMINTSTQQQRQDVPQIDVAGLQK